MKLNKIFLVVIGAMFALSACHNGDIEFDDYDYTTVYFASQYPIRTLELGEDNNVDNSLDIEHKVKITATMGGVYSNTKDRIIDVEVDTSLCTGAYFSESNSKIYPMPSSYYSLESNQITIESGSTLGGVIVSFTDDFFADEMCLSTNYVIPLVMTNVTNADSILQGDAAVDNPNRLVAEDWNTVPKDYILYAVKYVNPWHGKYLRRGVDVIDSAGVTSTDSRHEEYVAYDEVVTLTTMAYKKCSLPITIYCEDDLTTRADINVWLTFDDENNCTVSNDPSITSYSISGTGKFVTDGEENSWGGEDRDGLYLDYTVELSDLGYTYSTKDTLVARNRGITADYFEVVIE